MRRAHRALRERLTETLEAFDVDKLGGEDRTAVATMLETLRGSASIESAETSEAASDAAPVPVGCGEDPGAVATGDSALARLSAAIYACYGAAARRVVTPTDTADRLTVLGRLGSEPSSEAREALFMSLQPIWKSVTGDGSPRSPYRTMLQLSAAEWRKDGSPVASAARSLGLDPANVDSTLVRILRAWRDHTPATVVEPWDWFYQKGAASRALAAINLAALREPQRRFTRTTARTSRPWASASTSRRARERLPSPSRSLARRPGFGVGASAKRGLGLRHVPRGARQSGRAAARDGHAIHISGVHTRPAFADWPDNDPFTEALGDLLAMDAMSRRGRSTGSAHRRRSRRCSAPIRVDRARCRLGADRVAGAREPFARPQRRVDLAHA